MLQFLVSEEVTCFLCWGDISIFPLSLECGTFYNNWKFFILSIQWELLIQILVDFYYGKSFMLLFSWGHWIIFPEGFTWIYHLALPLTSLFGNHIYNIQKFFLVFRLLIFLSTLSFSRIQYFHDSLWGDQLEGHFLHLPTTFYGSSTGRWCDAPAHTEWCSNTRMWSFHPGVSLSTYIVCTLHIASIFLEVNLPQYFLGQGKMASHRLVHACCVKAGLIDVFERGLWVGVPMLVSYRFSSFPSFSPSTYLDFLF